MKKLLTFFSMALMAISAKAQTVFNPEDICYDFNTTDKVAEVISNPTQAYWGVVEIPETVIHEGKKYTVSKIASHAFEDCVNLTSVTIPNSVTSIGSWAFSGCSSLTSVTIPNGVTQIEIHTFWRCSSLTSVTIPDGVTMILNDAFRECSSLTSVTIPNSVTYIGKETFKGCSSLTSINIPNGVGCICSSTFAECSSLPSITLPSNLAFIEDQAFASCSALTSITIPNSVTIIEDLAFVGCRSLTSIIIPNSVYRIHSVAFQNCSNLTSVTIGSGIHDIRGLAFANCPKLKDVYCYAEKVPSTGDKLFDGTPIENATLHVLKGSLDAYKADEPWKSFKYKVEIEDAKVKLSKTKAVIEKGKTLTLKATITPSNLPDKSVTWKSSDTKVATVTSAGKVKGVKTGTATITCTSNSTGAKATCKVTVGSVKLDQTEIVVEKNKTKGLTATVYPSTLKDKSVTWTSSITAIAIVSSKGWVKGVKTGTALITCTSNATGLSTTCKVTVGSVKLDQTEIVIEKAKTKTLTATVYPSTLRDKSVTWTSSNTAVATVSSNGKVKGVRTGTATITCTSNATGLSATCEVTVGSVNLNQTEVAVNKGKTVTLKATVYPSSLTDQSVTWKSSNTAVATVSSNGKVKGVRTGTATITCTSNATGFSTTCEVTVGYVKLDQTEVTVKKDKTVTLKATVYPSTLEDKSVIWRSLDRTIAMVSNEGVVKGVKAGTATITCTSVATGLSATCTVTVTGSASTRSLDGDDDELTGIEENVVAVEPFDVYDLSGRKVLHQVTSLDGLPDGIYIVNGKKILKKK